MDSTFIYPVTIHRGDASGSLTAGWTTSLPANMSNSDELVAVLYTSEGQFDQGLYLKQSNSRNWRYIVPYSAICQGIINGSAVDVYYNVTTADSGLPTSAKIWRNGIETDNPTFTVNDGAVYGALTVATGDGQVSSVNGVLPDSTGDVTIGIPQIPGLEAALAAAGSVKTVNAASPDVNGNVTVPVGTTTVAGTVKGGGNVAIAVDGTLSYSLPVASISVLGGVKQGANVTIAGDGTISVAAPYTLPAATTTTLGGVIVGTGLSVSAGTISANVTSVNGHEGAVVLSASDITTGTFSAAVLGATPGDNEVLITNSAGVPTWVTTIPTANLPASILGAVDYQGSFIPGTTTLPAAATANKGFYYVATAAGTYTPPGGTLLTFAAGDWLISDGATWSTVATQGAVTSVNGQTGAVTVQAVDNNDATGTSLISDGGSSTGTVKLKTLVAGTNISITADGNGNLVVNNTATQTGLTEVSSVGTGTSLVNNNGTTGGIAELKSLAAGSNITITPDGSNQTLTITANQVITPATTTAIGGVIVKAGLTVDASGDLSLAAPTGVNLGGVKAGTGISIATDGTISVTAVGGVTSVSGQTGAVVVEATDTSTASGTSLITGSGATTGNIQIRRIVAGSGISLSTDGNNNLEITGTGGYTLPDATTTTLGGVIVGSGLAVSSGTISSPPATATTLGSVKVGSGLSVDGTGLLTATGGGVTSMVWGTSGALTGALTITAGQSISISNSGNTVQINGTGVPEAPNDGNLYGRQNMGWTIIPSTSNPITAVNGQTGTGAVLLVEASPPANTAVIKSLVAGANVTLTDNSGLITVAAALPSGTVASVNSVAPDVNGNVTLTAASVSALPIAGGNMAGAINMESNTLTGLAAPVNASDAVPLSYVTGLVIDGGVIG
jgi:hypothetical protein